MIKYIVRRLLTLIPILFGVSLIVFLTMRLLPGDVVTSLLSPEGGASPEVQAQIRRLLGLDRPLYVQYLDWVWHAVRGDLGISILSSKPIMGEILRRLPVTAELAILSIGLAAVVGIPLGVLSTVRHNSWLDAIIRIASLISLSVPGFWIGTLFVLAASLYVPTWPTLGFVGIAEDPIVNLQTMLLPTLSLGAYLVAGTIRMTRAAMLEVLQSDYITVARARGVPERGVFFTHALRNALIPVVTLLGLWLGSLLGGTVLIETVFTLPGLGKMVVDAITNRDYPVVQGTVLFMAAAFVLANLLVDVLYVFLDPRVRE